MLSSKQKEFRDLKIKQVCDEVKEEVILLTKDCKNIWEVLAVLDIRGKQLFAYNSMKKAINLMRSRCKHDYSKILAFEQVDLIKTAYLRRCKFCWQEKFEII